MPLSVFLMAGKACHQPVEPARGLNGPHSRLSRATPSPAAVYAPLGLQRQRITIEHRPALIPAVAARATARDQHITPILASFDVDGREPAQDNVSRWESKTVAKDDRPVVGATRGGERGLAMRRDHVATAACRQPHGAVLIARAEIPSRANRAEARRLGK